MECRPRRRCPRRSRRYGFLRIYTNNTLCITVQLYAKSHLRSVRAKHLTRNLARNEVSKLRHGVSRSNQPGREFSARRWPVNTQPVESVSSPERRQEFNYAHCAIFNSSERDERDERAEDNTEEARANGNRTERSGTIAQAAIASKLGESLCAIMNSERRRVSL